MTPYQVASFNLVLVAVSFTALGLNVNVRAFLLTLCLISLCAALTVVFFLLGVRLGLTNERILGWPGRARYWFRVRLVENDWAPYE